MDWEDEGTTVMVSSPGWRWRLPGAYEPPELRAAHMLLRLQVHVQDGRY